MKVYKIDGECLTERMDNAGKPVSVHINLKVNHAHWIQERNMALTGNPKTDYKYKEV